MQPPCTSQKAHSAKHPFIPVDTHNVCHTCVHQCQPTRFERPDPRSALTPTWRTFPLPSNRSTVPRYPSSTIIRKRPCRQTSKGPPANTHSCPDPPSHMLTYELRNHQTPPFAPLLPAPGGYKFIYICSGKTLAIFFYQIPGPTSPQLSSRHLSLLSAHPRSARRPARRPPPCPPPS